MKSWADHCSSDEESFNEDTPLDAFDDDEEQVTTKMENLHVQEPQAEPPMEEMIHEERTYDFPSGPPYTLFVGNLSYNIKDGNQLGDALGHLVHDRLKKEVRVVKGKIPVDRQNPNRHKGFGYVEVGSLEEMKLVLELNNDHGAQLAGRKVQLDTSNHNTGRNQNNQNNKSGGGMNRRASAPPEMADGHKFRAGKYNQNSNQNDHHQNNNKGGRRHSTMEVAAHAHGPPTTQRPSLKLKPRSVPIEAQQRGSKSDIFGGAKPRDETKIAWQTKDKKGALESVEPPSEDAAKAKAEQAAVEHNGSNQQTQQHNKDNNHKNNNKNDRRTSKQGGRGHDHNKHDNDDHNKDRRGSNRGGRGGRGGGGRDQKGRGGGAHKANKRDSKTTAPAPKAAAAPEKAPPAAAPAAPAPAPKPPKNPFAALGFDDSDSD